MCEKIYVDGFKRDEILKSTENSLKIAKMLVLVTLWKLI